MFKVQTIMTPRRNRRSLVHSLRCTCSHSAEPRRSYC